MQNFRSVLNSGEYQFGCVITYPPPGAVERIGRDWDWFWLDAQHGELDYSDVLALVRACDALDRPAFVRVPSHEPGWIMRALDTAAAGIIVPQVCCAAEAAEAVKAARFPPVGSRSYGGRRVVDMRGRGYSDTANSDTLLMVQLESPAAIAQAAEIAAVEGVDILLVGPDDVSLSAGGISMTAPKPVDMLKAWHEPVIEACRLHGKIPAAIGMGAELVSFYAAMGFRMLACGSDVGALSAGSRDAADVARSAVGGVMGKKADRTGSPY
ncbi:MAG: hypothetical protein JW909_06865 [Planctomycetes bacterium]|nr:hypothetical protein [Planctomycetota bacterium]